jgi:hypothetical protein
MASFRQRSNKWQARVSRDGYPDQVKTFEARVDAERWARSVEAEMDKGAFVDTQEKHGGKSGSFVAQQN